MKRTGATAAPPAASASQRPVSPPLTTAARPTSPNFATRRSTSEAPSEARLRPLHAAIQALVAVARRAPDGPHHHDRPSGGLSEAHAAVEEAIAEVEAVLSDGFKRRQFLLFKVHPWTLLEHAENFDAESAEAIELARAAGSTDSARLRAWVYVHLNRRTLHPQLARLCFAGIIETLYTPAALLWSEAGV